MLTKNNFLLTHLFLCYQILKKKRKKEEEKYLYSMISIETK